MRQTAVVLLSGGMDSAAALWWARERYRVLPLHYLVPGAPAGERTAARALAAAADLGGSLREVNLPFLVAQPVPRRSSPAVHPEGYLPRRNLVYYAIAGSIAEQEDAAAIVGGHLAADGLEFPDARPGCFSKLQELIGIPVVLPFVRWSKEEVVSFGQARGVPFELSWSCYRDAPQPCGECISCREREEAFAPKESQ